MAKYEVQIFGKVPDCIEVEAESADDACSKALEKIIDELDFEAELAEENEAAG